MNRIAISTRSAWFDTCGTGNKARFSSGLTPEVVFRSACALLHDLAQAMSLPCACVFSPSDFYLCCLFILKTSCFRDRSTFCTVFNKSGPKSLNSSEVSEFSSNADNVYLYTSDYRGEDHTIIFFLHMFYLPLYFYPLLIPISSKFLSSFVIC